MKTAYLELVSLIERLHRRFLDLVQMELTARKIDDLNGVQAMILFNIGDAELTVGEMTARGCYHGSNVSYNVKKLVENGYLAYSRSTVDRRVVRVIAHPEGQEDPRPGRGHVRGAHPRDDGAIRPTGSPGADRVRAAGARRHVARADEALTRR